MPEPMSMTPQSNAMQPQMQPVIAVQYMQYVYPFNYPEALQLIREAVAGETEDRKFYQYLIDNAPSEEDREIIRGIRDDEINHFNLFRQVYFQLTGQILPPPQNINFVKPATWCDGVKRAIRGEQNAVRKYRRILYALQGTDQYPDGNHHRRTPARDTLQLSICQERLPGVSPAF